MSVTCMNLSQWVIEEQGDWLAWLLILAEHPIASWERVLPLSPHACLSHLQNLYSPIWPLNTEVVIWTHPGQTAASRFCSRCPFQGSVGKTSLPHYKLELGFPAPMSSVGCVWCPVRNRRTWEAEKQGIPKGSLLALLAELASPVFHHGAHSASI